MGIPMNYNESLASVLKLFKSKDLPDNTEVEGTFNSHRWGSKDFQYQNIL